MHFNHVLHQLGLTPIEASVFITLCKHGALTGYEVAKLTGISRSNVYAALYSLQDKGMCHIAEGETTKYLSISKEELFLSTERKMKKTLADIEEFFPASLEAPEPYVTIRGYDNVLNKVKNSLLLCQSHLYLLSSSATIELLKEELLMIHNRCRVTIICETDYILDSEIVVYNRHKDPKGLHLIIDTQSVITGDLDTDQPQCLFSNNAALVRLMRESFVTELEIIALKQH